MLKIVSNYTLTQYINKGEYGKVYKAINHDNSQDVAIKMISLQKFIENSKLIQLTKQQAEILSVLENNQNIIKLKQIIKSNRYLYMVYEYCEGGTLEEYLNKNSKLTEKQAIIIFRQLINAYKSLYENKIVHRDIKTDNIFFKNGKLKLADFGFSKRIKYNDDLMQTSLGSPLYMAPEVLNNDVYGSKADLWSCGIILYQMIFGTLPYNGCNIKQLLAHYSQKTQIPLPYFQRRQVSPQLINMLRRMLTKDQFRRISWQEFLYEYSFSQDGGIIHKERDFEYDLMKLMKKNSSLQQNSESLGNQKSIKSGSKNGIYKDVRRFDWGKVTELNSSVHSEECSKDILGKTNKIQSSQFFKGQKQFEPYQSNSKEQQPLFYSGKLIQFNNTLNTNNQSLTYYPSQKSIHFPQQSEQLQNMSIHHNYNIKKTIKHFQQQHTKILQLMLILEQFLQSDQSYTNDLRVPYIIVCNIGELLKRNINEITEYLQTSGSVLQHFRQERLKLQRMLRIFSSQLQNNLTKLNFIKVSILAMGDQIVDKDMFKYPKNGRAILRRVMKEFVESFELEHEGVLDLIMCGEEGSKNQKGIKVDEGIDRNFGCNVVRNFTRQQQIRLVRILWAVQLLGSTQKNTSANNNSNPAIRDNVGINEQKKRKWGLLSIKQQTSMEQLSRLINSYLVEMGL